MQFELYCIHCGVPRLSTRAVRLEHISLISTLEHGKQEKRIILGLTMFSLMAKRALTVIDKLSLCFTFEIVMLQLQSYRSGSLP